MDINMRRTAWLFPGQGSQAVGMGGDLLASFAPARELLAFASDLTGADLRRIIAQGPDVLLTRTDHLQPALTVINLGCCMILQNAGIEAHAVAGHSLGEFSALYAAGVLDAHDVLRLVVARGQLMHEISATLDGGMMAVKGDVERRGQRKILECRETKDVKTKNEAEDERQKKERRQKTHTERQNSCVIEPIIKDATTTSTVGIANYNSPTQTVLSGDRADLTNIRAALTAAGGECVPLNVSGPWHSDLLAVAGERFAEVLKQVKFHKAVVPIVLNVTGKAESDPVAIQSAMEQQICRPVRWVDVQLTMHALGIQRFLEVGPGKTLRGLLRGIPALADCEVVNVDGPKALRFLDLP